MTKRVFRLNAVPAALVVACAMAGCTSTIAPTGSPTLTSVPEKHVTPPTPTGTIEPVIVVAAVDIDGKHVTASGYVQGVIEDGGTCSFAFTRDGSPTVTEERQGVADRESTACGAVQPDIAQFSRGSWAVMLTYSSPSGTFRSQPQTLEVP